MNTKFSAIELFAGAGGLSSGLKSAGFSVLAANEIEEDFASTLQLNHPGCKVIKADVHDLDFIELADSLSIKSLDLLSGGPPCQGFSTVGSKNKRDPRNSLFWEFLRAVTSLLPRAVIFENVSGFKRLYGSQAYKTLISELESLGYKTRSALIDASDYGLPQRRTRTIVVGWRDQSLDFEFPKPTHYENGQLAYGYEPKVTLMDAISDLPSLEPGEESSDYRCEPRNAYQARMRAGVERLTEHSCSNYGPRMQRVIRLIPPGGSVLDLPTDLRPKSYFANTYARLLPDISSTTITRNFGTPSSSRCIHPYQHRALSTREGARLQGFPDSYVFCGAKGSKNLQIGNAVPPILGEIVGRSLAELLRAG